MKRSLGPVLLVLVASVLFYVQWRVASFWPEYIGPLFREATVLILVFGILDRFVEKKPFTVSYGVGILALG